MLDTLRSSASGFGAKILLVFLILTFAIWGIGDMIRNPGRNMTVATVGDATITSSDYAHAIQRETENLRRLMGDRFSPEAAKSMGLPRYVLQQQIDHALALQQTDAMGLIPSDADMVRYIRSNPVFQDDKGNFDKAIFEAALKNISTSEKSYVDQLRHDVATNLLMDTLVAVTPINDTAARTLLAGREEKRTFSLYTLAPSLVSSAPQPDDAQVKEFYDKNASAFTAPEYRAVSYATVSIDDVPKDAAISEDDLHAAYAERSDEFKRPELRGVEQLLYKTEEEAKKAKAMLDKGESFAQVAKETAILNKDSVSMGKIERNGVFEDASNAIFSLHQPGVTGVIQSPFGWHIFRVTSIDLPTVLTFEEARPTLEKDLRQHNADNALSKLVNKLEDAIAGGNTLQEAAHDLNLKVQTAGPFDRRGATPDGTKAKDIPNLDKFVETAFKTDEKGESQTMTGKSGVFYVVRVESITPERVRPLAEVKSQIVAGYLKQDRAKRLAVLAKDIATKFVTPADRAAVIAKYNLQAVTEPALKRSEQKAGDTELPPQLVADVFAHESGQATRAYPDNAGDYVIAVTGSIISAPPPEKDEKMAAALDAIKRSMETPTQNEILEEYTHYLATKFPVSVNDSAVQAVTQ